MKRLNAEDFDSRPGDPAYFTGAVTLRPMGGTEAPSSLKLIRVEFTPGARTHWHTHTGVQILFVAAGRCRYQHEGGPVEEAGTGETVWVHAGEKHWHGATPDAPMAHIALNVALETTWLEAVTDRQYGG